MTSDEISRRIAFLKEVLKDAVERGDYYLEHDILDELSDLHQLDQETGE